MSCLVQQGLGRSAAADSEGHAFAVNLQLYTLATSSSLQPLPGIPRHAIPLIRKFTSAFRVSIRALFICWMLAPSRHNVLQCAGGQMPPRPPGGALFPIQSGSTKPGGLPGPPGPPHPAPALFPISSQAQPPSQQARSSAPSPGADGGRPQHSYSAGPSGPGMPSSSGSAILQI